MKILDESQRKKPPVVIELSAEEAEAIAEWHGLADGLLVPVEEVWGWLFELGKELRRRGY